MSIHRLHARDLLVRVDRSRGVPVGRQLEEQLRDAIRLGLLQPGTDLPSTRVLAEDIAVSRGVVVRAYGQLAAEGYLDVRQGASPSVRGVPYAPSLPADPPAADPRPKVRYDLTPGTPELSRFPRRAWLRSLQAALATAADADLGYIDGRGLAQLRREVARYLGRTRGVAADPERIVITAGTAHAVSLICRTLVRSGTRTVAYEQLSHRILHAVTSRAGLRAVGIPVDESGLVVGELDRAPGVAVVTPAHQFPTGVALSAERRSALLAWARAYGGLVVEVDYDVEFRHDRPPVAALQAGAPEHVAYVGCTTKTLAPGLRLGWAVLPSELVERVSEEVQSSTVQLSGVDQLALADFLERGSLDRHLRRMRGLYRSRRDTLVRALGESLPQLRVRATAGGLHVLVELPRGASEAGVRERAAARGLAVGTLSQHALPGYEGPPGLLLGYGSIAEPAIPTAVAELAAVLAAATA